MKGSGYIASDMLKVSLGNDELIQPHKMCYKLSFMNDIDCQIVVNGDGIGGIGSHGTMGFVPAREGWNMDKDDCMIHSFVIVTPNVKYHFWGGTVEATNNDIP